MCMSQVVLLSALAASSWLGAQEQERKISKKELPAPVLAAFQKAYPMATIKGLNEEKKEGKTYFEIESIDGKIERDLLYLADGSVAEIEESIETADLPPAVRAAVEAEYPKAKFGKAEKVTQGTSVHYDVKVRTHNGVFQVEASDSGKILKADKCEPKKK